MFTALAAAGLFGAVLMVVLGSRRRAWRRLERDVSSLTEEALPALVAAVEVLCGKRVGHLAVADLTLPTEAVSPPKTGAPVGSAREERGSLAAAITSAHALVLHMVESVETATRADSHQLEELVEERTSAIANANRNLAGSFWQRRQLLDMTVRATESERAHLAANLHDGPVQRLATLGLTLDRAILRLEREGVIEPCDLVKRARAGLTEEIEGLRRLMGELHPPVLDEVGLESAIQDQLKSWSNATGIGAHLDCSPHPSLSRDSETVAYRVVQEALTNVAKHAKAGFVRVSVSASRDGVLVVVRDDGRGFNAAGQPDMARQGHFGLVVMRERIELASGRFEVNSAPLMGTEIRAWLPAASSTPGGGPEDGLAKLLETSADDWASNGSPVGKTVTHAHLGRVAPQIAGQASADPRPA